MWLVSANEILAAMKQGELINELTCLPAPVPCIPAITRLEHTRFMWLLVRMRLLNPRGNQLMATTARWSQLNPRWPRNPHLREIKVNCYRSDTLVLFAVVLSELQRWLKLRLPQCRAKTGLQIQHGPQLLPIHPCSASLIIHSFPVLFFLDTPDKAGGEDKKGFMASSRHNPSKKESRRNLWLFHLILPHPSHIAICRLIDHVYNEEKAIWYFLL